MLKNEELQRHYFPTNPKPGDQFGLREKTNPKVSAKFIYFEIFLTRGLGVLLNPVDCLQHRDAGSLFLMTMIINTSVLFHIRLYLV